MIDILNNEGHVINASVSPKMIYKYDKSLIDVRESRIKEWDFYQFSNDTWTLQMTIGHASLFNSCNFTFINMKTGQRYESGVLSLHNKNSIIFETNPSENHNLEYKKGNFHIRFNLKDNKRLLIARGINKKLGDFDLTVEVPNNINNDKMCILIPFLSSRRQFYLNYKENYFDAKISFKSSKLNLEIPHINGLIDSGRGYWPYKHEWFWGNGSIIINNHTLGWNIGYGFGDTRGGTENFFFFDSIAHKIEINFNTANHPNGKIEIDSIDGSFHLTLKPYYNNHTETKVLWINNSCDQVFYKTDGYVIVDNKKYGFNDEISFLEHAKNRW